VPGVSIAEVGEGALDSDQELAGHQDAGFRHAEAGAVPFQAAGIDELVEDGADGSAGVHAESSRQGVQVKALAQAEADGQGVAKLGEAVRPFIFNTIGTARCD
jgi:hypothetical protein